MSRAPHQSRSLFADVEAFLASRFPESDLARAASPITHDVQLRFELGEPFPNGTETRLQQVNARVTGIIRDCFNPQDTILLLINDWQGPDPMFGNSTPGYLFDLLGEEHLDRAAERLVRLPDEGDDTAPAQCRQVILSAPFGSIGIEKILAGIANYEQGREPSIGQAVYFIAPERGTVFHMYDDRGCLVFADHPSRIVHLYRKYNDWIVDYWRDTIDALFAAEG